MRLFSLGISFPKCTLLLVSFITIFFLVKLSSLTFTISLHEIVDKKLPGAKRLEQMKQLFHRGNSAYLIFHGKNSHLNEEDLREIYLKISGYELNSDIIQVSSPYSIRTAQSDGPHKIWYYKLIDSFAPSELKKINQTPWSNVFSNSSGTDLLVEIMYKDSVDGGRYGSFNPAPIGDLLQLISTDFPENSNISVEIQGSAPYSYYMFEGIKHNSNLNYATLIVILLMLRLIFRSFKGGIILLFNLVTSGIWIFGAMSVLGISINVLNSSIFMMLSVAGLEDFVFLSNIRSKYGKDWKSSFKEIIVPSFFTSLTTMVGFGSLYFTRIEIIQEFGIIAAAGALLEWIMMFVVTPALLCCIPGLRMWTKTSKGRFSKVTELLTTRFIPRKIAISLLVIFPLGTYSLFNLNTLDTPTNMLERTHAFVKGSDYLEKSRGWVGEISIVFNDRTNIKENNSIMNTVRSYPGVIKVEDPFSMIDFLAAGFDKSARDMVLRDLKGTNNYKRIFSSANEARSIVYVESAYNHKLTALLDKIKKLCRYGDSCYPAGELVSYAEFSNNVMGALYRSLTSSLCLVGMVIIFLAYCFNKQKMAFKLLCSTFWGPFFMLVILWCFQVRINFLTCVFASVLIGLTGDNVIQFLFFKKGDIENGILRHAPASIMIALTMVMASLLFLGSAFVPPRYFGILLGIGIFASIIGDIWILESFTRNRK